MSGDHNDKVLAKLDAHNREKGIDPTEQVARCRQLGERLIGDSEAQSQHSTATGAPPEPEQPLEQGATLAKNEREEKIIQLAGYSRVEYDRNRAQVAKDLGIRTSTLDAEVQEVREDESTEKTLAFSDPDPWPQAVAGAMLLERIRSELGRYVILPEHAATAIALWIVHTWCHDAFFISPYLRPHSPQKRCGKSTLMMVLAELVRRALIATSASPAAIFRCIEKYKPTLLLDEADAWMKEHEELRAILNGGHSKRTARVLRTVGDTHEPYNFPTFCPKAISGIGRLVDTLEDRCISIPMRRKRPEEKVARLREDQLDLCEIRQQARRWAEDNYATLQQADPPTPVGLNDRAADNWRALLAIADLAGDAWPAEARKAALALSGGTDDEAIGVELLADIRSIFDAPNISKEQITSAVLAENLGSMAEKPWADWKQGKAITQPQVARLLKPFEIRPRTVRFGPADKDTAKGYLRSQFEDAFARYLPLADFQAVTPSHQHQNGSQSTSGAVTSGNVTPVTPSHRTDDAAHECDGVTGCDGSRVTDQNSTKAYANRGCDGVTGRNDAEETGSTPEEF